MNCPSCGAAADADATVCDLCGTAFDADRTEPAEAAAAVAEPTGDAPPAPFCHMCGQQSPEGARFCSACGTPLQAPAARTAKPAAGTRAKGARKARLPATPPPEPTPRFPTAYVFMVAAVGAMVVLALFMITRVSKTSFPAEQQQALAETRSSANGTDARQAAPLTGDVAAEAARLERELVGLEGDERAALQAELEALLIGAGRRDRVAMLREEFAEQANTAEAWKAAGNAFYEWMETAQGDIRFDAAQHAAEAYERALSMGPDDLVARTAMAMAYLNTRAPMQGVMQIRQVLETDPDHLEGNYYYGVMLMQINRLDQAMTQFEKVKELVGPDSPMYRQADMMIANIQTLGNAGS